MWKPFSFLSRLKKQPSIPVSVSRKPMPTIRQLDDLIESRMQQAEEAKARAKETTRVPAQEIIPTERKGQKELRLPPPMPETIRKEPTKRHNFLLLLSDGFEEAVLEESFNGNTFGLSQEDQIPRVAVRAHLINGKIIKFSNAQHANGEKTMTIIAKVFPSAGKEPHECQIEKVFEPDAPKELVEVIEYLKKFKLLLH